MKNLILICFLCIVGNTYSQVQWNYVSSSGGKCVDVHDGVITYSITGAIPPFTAVITNTAGCTVANSTVTSTTSQITFTGIPGCMSFYYLSLFDANNTQISNFQTSFGIYSSTPFTIAIASSTAASCSSCCDGKAYPSWSGGSFSMPGATPLFYLDNVYLASNFYPMMNICAGTHTLCASDNVGCQKCITFNMPGNSTGITEYSNGKEILGAVPNPASNEFKITYANIKDDDMIEVVSMTGQLVVWQAAGPDATGLSVNVKNLYAGIYFVRVISGTGIFKGSTKIVKE